MSDFVFRPPDPPENRPQQSDPPAPSPVGALPPEVEAELRRQAQEASNTRGVLMPLQPHAHEGAAKSSAGRAAGPSWGDRLKAFGPIGIFLIFIATKLKFLLALKFVLPFLKTGGSMLVSIGYYAWLGGWQFGVGFVGGIFVHEMGHVFVAWRYGHPVTAPLFIPGLGAVIFHKKELTSAYESAMIGIGGPVAGLLTGLAFLLAHYLTGAPVLLWLAYITFFLNLFNLAPFFPLDGGWITGAISPRIWLIGVVMLGVLVATGGLRNPLFILLLLLSLPRIWHGIKTGDSSPVGKEPATPRQKVGMGLAYLTLCGALAWLMAHTHVPMQP